MAAAQSSYMSVLAQPMDNDVTDWLNGCMGIDDYYEELRARGFGETGDQSVCVNCIFDENLREQIVLYLKKAACTFCGRVAEDDDPVAAPFEELMQLIIDAIKYFYERSEDTLFWSDDVTPRYDSQEIVQEFCAGLVADNVLEEICETVNDDQWNEDPSVLRPDVALRYAWNDFREKVKHRTRFVFLSIREESSSYPDDFTTSEILEKLVSIIMIHEILVDVAPGHTFFRGRMVDKPVLVDHNASTLGPPPMVASANRMSPAGISMFYGCDDIPTVVAEIGSHTAKRFAVIGAFDTIRPLRMVNLTSLPVPSRFDPVKRQSYYELVFLHQFTRDLSATVMLDGSEHIEYVPTQVVTEYMRWLPDTTIDGILFRSSQNGGVSCVLFCGPEGCTDEGKETDETMLRLKTGSVQVVRVVPGIGDM